MEFMSGRKSGTDNLKIKVRTVIVVTCTMRNGREKSWPHSSTRWRDTFGGIVMAYRDIDAL